MAGKVLVAYATKHGSTKEVAEAVAQGIREGGWDVDLLRAKDVRSLEGYHGIIIGAPLYIMRWHGDAKRFLSRHRNVLKKRPVAVFGLGPFHDDEKEYEEVHAQLAKELAKFDWFLPLTVQVFGGKFDPLSLRFPYNLIPAMKSIPASDVRDWTAIRAWAGDMSGRFQSL